MASLPSTGPGWEPGGRGGPGRRWPFGVCVPKGEGSEGAERTLRLKLGFTWSGTSFDGLISSCSAPCRLVSCAGAWPRCLPAFPSLINLHLHPLPFSVSCPAASPSEVPVPGATGGSCRPMEVWAAGTGWALLPQSLPCVVLARLPTHRGVDSGPSCSEAELCSWREWWQGAQSVLLTLRCYWGARGDLRPLAGPGCSWQGSW